MPAKHSTPAHRSRSCLPSSRSNVGDTIRIENQDDRGHTVGPFFVGANETLTQRFSTPGEFEGVCTVHPSGQLVLIVNA